MNKFMAFESLYSMEITQHACLYSLCLNEVTDGIFLCVSYLAVSFDCILQLSRCMVKIGTAKIRSTEIGANNLRWSKLLIKLALTYFFHYICIYAQIMKGLLQRMKTHDVYIKKGASVLICLFTDISL